MSPYGDRGISLNLLDQDKLKTTQRSDASLSLSYLNHHVLKLSKIKDGSQKEAL